MGMTEKEFSDSLLLALTNNSELADKIRGILCKDLITEVHTLRDVVQKRDERMKKMEDTIQEQSHLIDTLEQYSRRNSLRVNGIAESEELDLLEACMALFNDRMAVDPPIRSEDIDRLHRVGKPGHGKKRPVLVKFAAYRAKERVYLAKSRLKPGARDPSDPWSGQSQTPASTLPATEFPPLNPDAPPYDPSDQPIPAADQTTPDADDTTPTADPDPEHVDPSQTPVVQLPKPLDKITKAISDKIYINDDLTSKRDYLLYVARQSKKQQNILDTWAHNGNIRIKDKNGVIHTVNGLSDIPDSQKIINPSQK